MQCPTRPLLALCVSLSGCMPDVVAPETVPTVTALFDPRADPPVVPTPTDLAFRGGDGKHLAIMDRATDSPAQRELNAYLRTLDGFPSSSTASAAFSGSLDPASVYPQATDRPGSVLVIDLQTGAALDASAVRAELSADGTRIVITPLARWLPAHRYGVAVFGGQDPAGVRGRGGEIVIASPTFFLLRADEPLVACASPADCRSVVRGVDDATARAAEVERAQLDALLDALFARIGRQRTDLVLAWTFTITSLPTAVFDPARGAVPFPNDLLIDQATGLVNLPIAPGDPQAALKQQLNTLDGFSVSAPVTASVDLPAGGAIDPATVAPGQSTILARIAQPPELASFVATAPLPDTIALRPLEALRSEQSRYGVVLTRGIRDREGRALEAPPAMVLVLNPHPLFDGTHSTVNVLSDEQAAQLERLRLAFQPLVAQLAAVGLPRDQIALAWTFTTQSIMRPLMAVDAFPAQAGLLTRVEVRARVAGNDLATIAPMLAFPTANLHAMILGTFHSEDVIDRSQGRIVFDRTGDVFSVHVPPGDPPTTIRFWLSLPRTTASAAGAPVVILQHGFTSWRGDMVALADDFARQGWAAIAFDIDFHGARAACTSDAHCVSGACMNGACAAGLKMVPASQSPLACSLQPLSGDPLDCNTVASGAAYLDPANLFRARANGQAYVLDAAQLVRVLRSTAPGSLSAAVQAIPGAPTLDPTRIAFLGHSLGAVGGTLFVAVDPAPATVVLNSGAAHLFEALAQGGFAPLVDRYLDAIGVRRDTPEYARLVATADWVLDAVDPFAVGRQVRQPIIVQELGMDATIPPPFQQALGLALFGPAGLDAQHHLLGRQTDGTAVSTWFPTAVHGTLTTGQPSAASVPMRAQAATFIGSGGAVLPPAE